MCSSNMIYTNNAFFKSHITKLRPIIYPEVYLRWKKKKKEQLSYLKINRLNVKSWEDETLLPLY